MGCVIVLPVMMTAFCTGAGSTWFMPGAVRASSASALLAAVVGLNIVALASFALHSKFPGTHSKSQRVPVALAARACSRCVVVCTTRQHLDRAGVGGHGQAHRTRTLVFVQWYSTGVLVPLAEARLRSWCGCVARFCRHAAVVPHTGSTECQSPDTITVSMEQ